MTKTLRTLLPASLYLLSLCPACSAGDSERLGPDLAQSTGAGGGDVGGGPGAAGVGSPASPQPGGGAVGVGGTGGLAASGGSGSEPGVGTGGGADSSGSGTETVCGVQNACVLPGSRDAAYWPFDSCSPWNHPIGDGAVYEEISIQPTSPTFKNYGSWINSWNDFGCLGSRTDNLVIVENAKPSYAGTISGSGQTYSFNIPSDMVMPPASDDGHIYFVKADRSESYETYLSFWTGSNIGASWLVKNYSLSDSGNMPEGDEWSYRGTRAYGGSAMAGLIRRGELVNGVKHAITLKAPQQALNKNGPDGNCWTWPATACDGEYSSYATSGNLLMGSLVAIPPTADLSFITDPRIQNLAIALRDYGGYVTDRGSDIDMGGFPSCWQFMTEYALEDLDGVDTEYEQLGRLAGLLQVVVNNGPNSIGGGGKPRACFAPEL